MTNPRCCGAFGEQIQRLVDVFIWEEVLLDELDLRLKFDQ